MAEMTWLQCQITKDDWNKLNERRLRLGLKWADILLPATLEYLDKLEANPPTVKQPQAEKTKTKARKAK
jgi:hypothetical protein